MCWPGRDRPAAIWSWPAAESRSRHLSPTPHANRRRLRSGLLVLPSCSLRPWWIAAFPSSPGLKTSLRRPFRSSRSSMITEARSGSGCIFQSRSALPTNSLARVRWPITLAMSIGSASGYLMAGTAGQPLGDPWRILRLEFCGTARPSCWPISGPELTMVAAIAAIALNKLADCLSLLRENRAARCRAPRRNGDRVAIPALARVPASDPCAASSAPKLASEPAALVLIGVLRNVLGGGIAFFAAPTPSLRRSASAFQRSTPSLLAYSLILPPSVLPLINRTALVQAFEAPFIYPGEAPRAA